VAALRAATNPARLSHRSLPQDPYDAGGDGIDLGLFQMPDLVKHNVLVGSEQAIRPDIAGLAEAAGCEVFVVKQYRIPVADLLTGNLAQD
jgi:hypothetical protein